LALVLAVVVGVLPGGPAMADPVESAEGGERSLSALLRELRGLYQEAEAAGEAYNAAAERLRARRERVDELSEELAATRTELTEAQRLAGLLAREQYRGGGIELPPSLRLLLGEDPGEALHAETVAVRAAADHAATLRRLRAGERRADRLARREREALDARQAATEEQRRQRDTARRRMDEVAGLLAGLSEEQLAELAEWERGETARAQEELLDTEVLDDGRAPTAAGERALDYAMAQRGKPYAWGAEGPDAFDCSGLTAQAWARAERPIPRTSQQQWRQLPRVPLDQLRPGDLVVYFDDATHVAMYAGEGNVVHAPRPGAAVKLSPIAAGPVLGAVRPDAA
jgi:peptidoglycan DL-endopeptidase CwlO